MTTIQESDISNLAKLARISLKPEEITQFTKDIQSIVGFIDIVNNKEINEDLLKQEGFVPVNVMRDDVQTQNDYMTAEEIINLSPSHQDNAIKVKKIIAAD